MRESGVPRIRPAISFKSFGARVRNVQTRENENREYENFALNNGSRFMKDYLPALSDGRETWQPLWESEVGSAVANEEAVEDRSYVPDYPAAGNRDAMVFADGMYAASYAHSPDGSLFSASFAHAEGTHRGESGENLEANYHGAGPDAVYTGYAYDKVLGLFFAQARFYDPENKRFTQEDPVKDGGNWYAYVGNSPLIFTDPDGLKSYVFYHPGRANAAEAQMKSLEKFYGKNEVEKILIQTEDDFVDAWNGMDTNADDAVFTILHGNLDNIFANDNPNTQKINLEENLLEDKTMKYMVLLSCNTGHYDKINDNPASWFAVNMNIKYVVGVDGYSVSESDGKIWVRGYSSIDENKVKNTRNFELGISSGSGREGRSIKGYLVIQENNEGQAVITKELGTHYDSPKELLKTINKSFEPTLWERIFN